MTIPPGFSPLMELDPTMVASAALAAWSALIALARRWLVDVERKLDETGHRVGELSRELATVVADNRYRLERDFKRLADDHEEEVKALADRIEATRRDAIRREEFALLVANLNVRLESIHDRLNPHEQ